MEVQVTITLSDKLFALLEDKLPNLGRRMERQVTKEIGAQVRSESNVAITVKPGEPGAPEPSAPVEVKVAAIQTGAPAPAETPAEEPVKEAPAPKPDKTPGEMIREIMDRTCRRFEGDDYRENTGSEEYRKYHKPLLRMYRQIAGELGYDKPSLIDKPEDIESFGAQCDALVIDEKGFIAAPEANF